MQVTLQPSGAVRALEPGERILDGARRLGYDCPNSCRNGNCHVCAALLVEGRVRQDGEVRDHGELFTCIAEPLEDCVLLWDGVLAEAAQGCAEPSPAHLAGGAGVCTPPPSPALQHPPVRLAGEAVALALGVHHGAVVIGQARREAVLCSRGLQTETERQQPGSMQLHNSTGR